MQDLNALTGTEDFILLFWFLQMQLLLVKVQQQQERLSVFSATFLTTGTSRRSCTGFFMSTLALVDVGIVFLAPFGEFLHCSSFIK